MVKKPAPQIAKEIKPMRPLSGVTEIAQEAFLDIMRTAEALKHDIEELLKRSGLSITQYNVLRILRGAGTDGLTCQEVIERMINRDPDVTRLLDRLEDRGLVTRERSREDRRVVRAYLTKEGVLLVEKLDDPVAELHVQQLGHLGEKKLHSLRDMLVATRERLA